MKVLTLAAVLSLISAAATEPQTCEDLVQSVPLNKTQISGKWIFIEGAIDTEKYSTILKEMKSSLMDIVVLDNGTSTLKLGTMMNGKCVYEASGMNFAGNIFIVSFDNVPMTCAILPSSPDSLIMSLLSLDSGDIISSLYVFGRTKTISESDLQMYHKQLECLKLPQPSFKYDGKSEICPDQETPA